MRINLYNIGGCLVFVFSLPITLFPSPITQNMWVPRLRNLFGIVFSFCFHHLILWFLSDKLWKLKTHFRCFQFPKLSFHGIFVNIFTWWPPFSVSCLFLANSLTTNSSLILQTMIPQLPPLGISNRNVQSSNSSSSL